MTCASPGGTDEAIPVVPSEPSEPTAPAAPVEVADEVETKVEPPVTSHVNYSFCFRFWVMDISNKDLFDGFVFEFLLHTQFYLKWVFLLWEILDPICGWWMLMERSGFVAQPVPIATIFPKIYYGLMWPIRIFAMTWKCDLQVMPSLLLVLSAVNPHLASFPPTSTPCFSGDRGA